MIIILKKIQKLLEEHVFRKNGERFIMLLATITNAFFNYLWVKFGSLSSDEDFWLLLSFVIFIDVLYLLLMKKMVSQYIRKHFEFDSINWKKGLKGKLRVINKWFDRGE